MIDQFVKISSLNINLSQIAGYGLRRDLFIYVKGSARPICIKGPSEVLEKYLINLDKIFGSSHLIDLDYI